MKPLPRQCEVLLLALMLIVAPYPAYAGQSEARETARMNNCPPKKVEVYRQHMGESGETVYRIECNLPKMTDTTMKGPQISAMLISCVGSLCNPLRQMESEKK